MKLIGYYDDYGYRIEDDDNGTVLYEAGNNPLESTSHVINGLPVETLKRYCKQTGQEMAEELGAEWLGAFENEEE